LYEIIAILQSEVRFLKNKHKEFEEEWKDASEEIKMLKDKHKELEERCIHVDQNIERRKRNSKNSERIHP